MIKFKNKGVFGKFDLPPGYLFYPAQFWSHKNHINLLFAIKLLRDKYDLTLPVVFVGSDQGNEMHVKRMVGRLGLNKQVHFLGFVSEEDLVSKLRPGVDGLIMQDGNHRGTFLPSVWKAVKDKRDFLNHLKQKSGLPVDYWSVTLSIQRYTVEEF